AESAGGVVFGSELKALLRVPDVARRVDGEAVLNYLRWGYVPDPLSILEDVKKLPPGHTVLVRDGRVAEAPRRYWDPLPFFAEPRLGSEAALLEALRWRLGESLKSHLGRDVPLGAFLSGGVDSPALVARGSARHALAARDELGVCRWVCGGGDLCRGVGWRVARRRPPGGWARACVRRGARVLRGARPRPALSRPASVLRHRDVSARG